MIGRQFSHIKFQTTTGNIGFSAMLTGEYVLIAISPIGWSSGCTNKAEQQNIIPAFKAMHLSLSYLRLESDRVSNKQDSVYNFTQKLSKKGQVFTLNAATHLDFSYLPVLVNASGGCKDKEVYPTITALTIGFLEEHIGSKKVFSGVLKQALNQTVRRK